MLRRELKIKFITNTILNTFYFEVCILRVSTKVVDLQVVRHVSDFI
jgi:hypothetical protein